MRLELQPITLREARAFVNRHHRHHRAPQGGLFAVAVNNGNGVLVGVAIVGRPVARHLDNGWTAEVTRLCVLEGFPHACSKLYAACWRAVRAMGYHRAITYILASERGYSVEAAGWRCVGKTKAEGWNRPSRPRVDTHPVEQKLLWEACA